jgi:hypothetical protein
MHRNLVGDLKVDCMEVLDTDGRFNVEVRL